MLEINDKNCIFFHILKKQNEEELFRLYQLYSWANIKNAKSYTKQDFFNLDKNQMMKECATLFKVQINDIFKFFPVCIQQNLKRILGRVGSDISVYLRNKEFRMTMYIIEKLGLIYKEEDGEEIQILLSDYIANVINSANIYYDAEKYYKTMDCVMGMTEVYGAIKVKDALDIVKDDIFMDYTEFVNMIKFVGEVKVIPLNYNEDMDAFLSLSITDKFAKKLLDSDRKLYKYTFEQYAKIGINLYLMELKEYENLAKYIKKICGVDLKEDIDMSLILVNEYIAKAQSSLYDANIYLQEQIEEYFGQYGEEKEIIASMINKIRSVFPVWKKGGQVLGI